MNPYLLRIASLSVGQALVAGGFVTFLYWQMAYDNGSRFDKQVTALRVDLEKERDKERESDRALARVNQLRESYEALTEQFKLVSSQIPGDMQISELIKTVDTMAKTSGITIKSKEPRVAHREDILEIFPIRVVAEGSFAEMTMFFYNLSTIDRIYRIKTFSVSAPDDNKVSKRLTVDAELTSFRFAGVLEDASEEEKRKRGGG